MSTRAEHRFTCRLASGLHARPASALAERAGAFASRVTLTRLVSSAPAPADVRSVLAMVALDVHEGDACVIVAEGQDADAAIAALRELIEDRLVHGERAAAGRSGAAGIAARVPRALREAGVAPTLGHGVSPGVGLGRAVVMGGLHLTAEAQNAAGEGPGREREKVLAAMASVHQDLRARQEGARDATARAILGAHAQIAGDPAFVEAIERAVAGGASAARAVAGAGEEFAARLAAASSAYVRERALDVRDVAGLILNRLLPGGVCARSPALTADSVVFAQVLTPSQFLALDRAHLKGLALGAVGPTSHTVILARTFGVPCVVGLPDPARLAKGGEESLVDADAGLVLSPLPDAARAFYARAGAVRAARAARLAGLGGSVVRTGDNHPVEVAANASSPREVADAIEQGADSIGLYRTEFLFIERDAAPSEDEQFEVYAEAIRNARGKDIIFRTFDLGADKPAPFMPLSAEENPYLGVRGVRLHQRFPDVLDTQVRALVRASAGAPRGRVKVMAPMISTPEEAAWFRERVVSAAAMVRAPVPPTGVMLEVPAACCAIDLLAPHADFFSLGTNDLAQYFLATDRGNADVATLCNPHHPAFLRFLRQTVGDARRAGRWIGVCGDMGGRVESLPLLIGLGVNEVSGPASGVLELKARAAQADRDACAALIEAACRAGSPEQVGSLLRDRPWRGEGSLPLIDPACIDLDVDVRTKAEAIRRVAEALWIQGRTDALTALEDAIWVREDTYSTGLGYGLAMPHCQTRDLHASSLVVLRFRQPIDWGSLDDEPVHTLLFLGVRAGTGPGSEASKAHMKIFATLARRVMDETFRADLACQKSAGSMAAFLRQHLGAGA